MIHQWIHQWIIQSQSILTARRSTVSPQHNGFYRCPCQRSCSCRHLHQCHKPAPSALLLKSKLIKGLNLWVIIYPSHPPSTQREPPSASSSSCINNEITSIPGRILAGQAPRGVLNKTYLTGYHLKYVCASDDVLFTCTSRNYT